MNRPNGILIKTTPLAAFFMSESVGRVRRNCYPVAPDSAMRIRHGTFTLFWRARAPLTHAENNAGTDRHIRGNFCAQGRASWQ